MAAGLSLREYARRRDVSAEAVRKAIKTGRLSKSVGRDAKGWPVILDPDLADREWSANTSTVRRKEAAVTPRRPALSQAPRQAPETPAVDIHSDEVDPETGVPPLRISEARKAHWDALKAQAAAEEAMGRLLQRDEIVRTAFEVARQVRDGLLQIEDRLPDQLAAITDPEEIRARLREEFRGTLDKLAADVQRLGEQDSAEPG